MRYHLHLTAMLDGNILNLFFLPEMGKKTVRQSLQWFSSQTFLIYPDDLSENSQLKPWSRPGKLP